MLLIEQFAADTASAAEASVELVLAFEARTRSRLRTRLSDGEDVGVFLPRGTLLRDGDLLQGSDGRVVRVTAAVEQLAEVRSGDPVRVALEGYPGLLAHELIGRRSYKNSAAPDRLIARKDLLEALEQGRTRLGLRLKLTHAQRDALADDASGDRLDAVLCLAQAAWASGRPGYGLPAEVDAVEGWIVSA